MSPASRLRWIIIAALAVLIAAMFILGRGLKPVRIVPVLGHVPAFTLTAQDGSLVTRESLGDRPWIADFIFTSCAGQCPDMSNAMMALQSKLNWHKDLKLVSFSVDPIRDTPEKLTAYARRFHADPSRWIFLTGDENEIRRLSREGFKLGVEQAPADAPNIALEPILHSSRFVLVDAQGRIRGYYDVMDPEKFSQLETDLKSL